MVALSTITQSLLATYGMRKIFGRIPPVGNPITIKTSNEVPVFPGSLKTYFLNSGTAALAAGLQIAQQHCKAKKPEVIIPAYCCPDLLSAILYNNMKPVLVDFIPDKPYMDLNGIEEALNENTVAVIAVNFLGIPERFREIKQLLQDMPTLLIEDSCQWFPESNEAFASHEGDLVVYSFGKGKPISLLGGGALSLRSGESLNFTPCISGEPKSVAKAVIVAKYFAYNRVISPSLYWTLELLPFLALGQTKYHSLNGIAPTKNHTEKFLGENISSYKLLDSRKQTTLVKLLSAHQTDGLYLPCHCETWSSQRLLRHPFLLKQTKRQTTIIERSTLLGLGVSALYGKTLSHISGIPAGVLSYKKYRHAEFFAARLLTIPNHSHVSNENASSIFEALKAPAP